MSHLWPASIWHGALLLSWVSTCVGLMMACSATSHHGSDWMSFVATEKQGRLYLWVVGGSTVHRISLLILREELLFLLMWILILVLLITLITMIRNSRSILILVCMLRLPTLIPSYILNITTLGSRRWWNQCILTLSVWLAVLLRSSSCLVGSLRMLISGC